MALRPLRLERLVNHINTPRGQQRMQPTNPNQFTEEAWEAIAHTPDIVKAAQQQQIETEHLMK